MGGCGNGCNGCKWFLHCKRLCYMRKPLIKGSGSVLILHNATVYAFTPHNTLCRMGLLFANLITF